MKRQPSPVTKRVGFLFNHDELHQVAHTAPIISALQRRSPGTRVEVITSSEKQVRAVRQFLDPAQAEPAFWSIRPQGWIRMAEKLLGNLVPLGRLNALTSNGRLLQHFDALVVPETTSTILKAKGALPGTRLIFFPHGAGDRSVGFSSEIGLFDFVLLPGTKTRNRMLNAGIIDGDNHSIVGYPKFEVFEQNLPPRIFDNDKPVILYNPHFDPRLSSWFKFGEQILDYFADQDEYNLIFAPHVMLFRRRILASMEHRTIKFRRDIPARFSNLDHIHIDEGSQCSVDMSYTRAADIYLGDVSSQIYEFIRTPRPAIFLNSHEARWRNDPNYDCWHFGPVLDDLSILRSTLANSCRRFRSYAHRQKRAFAQTFDMRTDISSADRAAAVLAEYLELPQAGEVDASRAEAVENHAES